MNILQEIFSDHYEEIKTDRKVTTAIIQIVLKPSDISVLQSGVMDWVLLFAREKTHPS